MGEHNGRINGHAAEPGVVEKIAAGKEKQARRVARLTKQHGEVIAWMKSHVNPEIRDIDDLDIIDILAVMVGHLRFAEARIESLELAAKGEEQKQAPRILVP